MSVDKPFPLRYFSRPIGSNVSFNTIVYQLSPMWEMPILGLRKSDQNSSNFSVFLTYVFPSPKRLPLHVATGTVAALTFIQCTEPRRKLWEILSFSWLCVSAYSSPIQTRIICREFWQPDSVSRTAACSIVLVQKVNRISSESHRSIPFLWPGSRWVSIDQERTIR